MEATVELEEGPCALSCELKLAGSFIHWRTQGEGIPEIETEENELEDYTLPTEELRQRRVSPGEEEEEDGVVEGSEDVEEDHHQREVDRKGVISLSQTNILA